MKPTPLHDAHVFEWRQWLPVQWSGLPTKVYKDMVKRGLELLLRSMTFEEIEAAGFYALVKASQKYDPARGVKFVTYAYQAITKQILKEAKEAGVIRVPSTSRKCKNVRARTLEQMDAASVVHRIDLFWDLAQKADEQVGKDELEKLHKAIDKLKPRLRRLVRDRFFKGETLQAIGKRMGITKERVRQLWEKAKKQLHDVIGA